MTSPPVLGTGGDVWTDAGCARCRLAPRQRASPAGDAPDGRVARDERQLRGYGAGEGQRGQAAALEVPPGVRVEVLGEVPLGVTAQLGVDPRLHREADRLEQRGQLVHPLPR